MRIFLLMLISSFCFFAQAQNEKAKGPRSLNFEKIDSSQVPDPLKKKFESSFTGATVIHWEKHLAAGNATFTSYVAVFMEGGVRSRARYKEDATFLSASKYFGPQKLPANIKAAAKAKYPDAAVMGGAEITTRNGKTYYRVRSRKGNSRIMQYFDADGNEIAKDKAPEELLDGEIEN